MRCTSPRTVGFLADGKTISWSLRKCNKEYATFQLPCGKCIACRLEYARQWAIRCVHEAQMHSHNCFLTLTYSDDRIRSDQLIYSDYQNFTKRLRKSLGEPISYIVAGEYGEKTQRPHWHSIVFNWMPPDRVYRRTTELGHKVYTSATLSGLWPHGHCEIGSVTFESAGYIARYAAKKLVHGHDESHPFQPIFKTSRHRAIGKTFIEKHWPDVFSLGAVLMNGQKSSIPRYYEKWFMENLPAEYLRYVTQKKVQLWDRGYKKSEKQKLELLEQLQKRRERGLQYLAPYSDAHKRRIIQQERFKMLQSRLKL